MKLDSIALSSNGEIVAAASGTVIQLCEVRTGLELSKWVGHNEMIMELAFSPDGKFLASVSSDNTAALWDVPSGTLRWKSQSHTLAVLRLAFSSDGRTLATSGVDALRLWHVQTGRELMSIHTPSEAEVHFGAVRFSPDSTAMAARLDSPAQFRFLRAPSLAAPKAH